MNVSLVLVRNDGSKKVFPIREKATVLGRRPECDLCIPLQVVSRRHCQLSIEDNVLKVRDLSSSNGTFLNGEKVQYEAQAKAGDVLQIGPLTFVIQIDGQPVNPSLPANVAVPSPDVSKADDNAMNRSGTFVG